MKKKISSKTALVAAILILIAACIGVWFLYQKFIPKGAVGNKEITVTVVHADKSSKNFIYQTEEAYLGAVLKENGLVEGDEGQYGMFITSADQEMADASKQQWWCLTKQGEQVNTSADQTPIEDGDSFELTLTEGY